MLAITIIVDLSQTTCLLIADRNLLSISKFLIFKVLSQLDYLSCFNKTTLSIVFSVSRYNLLVFTNLVMLAVYLLICSFNLASFLLRLDTYHASIPTIDQAATAAVIALFTLLFLIYRFRVESYYLLLLLLLFKHQQTQQHSRFEMLMFEISTYASVYSTYPRQQSLREKTSLQISYVNTTCAAALGWFWDLIWIWMSLLISMTTTTYWT